MGPYAAKIAAEMARVHRRAPRDMRKELRGLRGNPFCPTCRVPLRRQHTVTGRGTSLTYLVCSCGYMRC